MTLFATNTKNISACLSLFLIVFSFSGCGYHFRTTGKPQGIDIQSIAIPMITSTSSHTGFEGDFTKFIREEFVTHAKIPLVSRDKASVILIGKVKDIRTEVTSYHLTKREVGNEEVNYEVTRTRRLRVRLNAGLVDGRTGKVIWKDNDMRESATFTVSDDPLATSYNKKKALREIARRFGERVYMKTMERF